MAQSFDNPYSPPQPENRNPKQQAVQLYHSTLAHRRLLTWFALFYLLIGLSYFLSSNVLTFTTCLIASMALASAAWRCLLSGISTGWRIGLTLLAMIPLFGLVTILLNHWWLTQSAERLNVPSLLLGPDLDVLKEIRFDD